MIQSPEVSPIESDEEEDVPIDGAGETVVGEGAAAVAAEETILEDLRTESVSPAPLAPNDDDSGGGGGQVGGKKIKKKKGKKEKKEKRKLKKKKRRESLAQQQQLEQEQALQQVQPPQGEDQGERDRQAAFGSPLSSDPDFKQSPVVGCNRRRIEESNGDMAKAAKQSHRPSGPHTPPPPPTRRPPRTPPEPPNEDGDSPGTPVYNESGSFSGKRQPQTPPEPVPEREPSDLPFFTHGRTLQEMLASGRIADKNC